jgi:hypothetical protein
MVIAGRQVHEQQFFAVKASVHDQADSAPGQVTHRCLDRSGIRSGAS